MFVAPVSTWMQANSWANTQGSPIQQVMTVQDVADAAFASAQTDYFQGTAGLAGMAALKRLQAAGKPEPAPLQTLIGAVGAILNTIA
jgi:hypothetical protein